VITHESGALMLVSCAYYTYAMSGLPQPCPLESTSIQGLDLIVFT
jgi:hypothetical protein